MTIEIRRAEDRARTKIAWLNSKHSFSFGSHYDPGNTHHGLHRGGDDVVVQAHAESGAGQAVQAGLNDGQRLRARAGAGGALLVGVHRQRQAAN